MHQYKNSKITLENAKEDWLHWSETIQATLASTEQNITRKQKGKEKQLYVYNNHN